MGKVVGKSRRLTLETVQATIAFDQPKLQAERSGTDILISGTYLLYEADGVARPGGPITTFDVSIVLSSCFPREEPKVFEVGGRIPRIADRHVNPAGDCCITIWEHWLASAEDLSFAAFMTGPIHEFFIAQYVYEQTARWPFGERAHGAVGLVEAYAELLGIQPDKTTVVAYLRLLTSDWPKGHCSCPCGSNKRLRHCHRDELMALHRRIRPSLAQRMVQRMKANVR